MFLFHVFHLISFLFLLLFLFKPQTITTPVKCSIPPNTVFKQPSELTTYLACEVLTGDLYFRPTTTFSSFPKLAVSRLEGSLFIINTTIPISNFNLMPNLTHVTGAVVISNNTGLVSLSGMRLYRIDGGFFAVRNPSLVDLAIISTLTAVGDSSESSQVPLTYFSSEELNALYLTEGYSPLFTLRFNPKITNFTLSNIYFRYISSSAVITGNKLLCPSSFPHVFGEGSLFGECGSCDFDSVYAFPDRFLACTALNLYQEYTFNREMIDFFKGNLESATTMTCYYDGPALELYFPEVDAAQLFPNLVSIYGCRLNFKDITRTGSFELGFPKLVNGISSEFNFENITATSGTVTLFSKLATATVIDFQSLTMNVLNAFPSFTGSPPDSFDSQSISFHDCQFNTLRGFNSTNRALVYFESTAVSNTFSAFQNTTILHTLELNGIDVSKFIFPKLKTVTDSVATVNSNGTSFGPNFPQLGSVSYISVSISEIQTISFAKLQTVDRIFFSELPLLTTISGFDSLTTCIDIHLSTLNAISTLPNFTALATAGNIVLDVLPNITTISSFKNLRNLTTEGDAFGTLTISNHLNLITISGFVRLQSVVGLTLSNCPYLNKISGLQSLSTISSTASFKQLNSGSLTSLALRSLASVGVLEISMNAYLKTFFFPALVELTGDEDNLSGCNSGHIVCIYDNPNFLSLAGFPKLASINGSIDISGNPNFCHGFPTPQAFPDPELYESNNKGDCAVLTFNGVLSTWEDFASIVGYSKISGDVAFSPNFDPTGLYTLPNLNEIIGSLNVSNSQAKNLEFMSSITNVKSLVISNNTALKSLAGFAVVSTSYLVIENNPVLESLPNFSGTTLTAEYGVYPSNTILSIQFNPSLKSLSPLSSSSSSIMITGSGYIYLKNNALLCVDSIPPVFVSSFSPYLKTDNCSKCF